MDLGLENKIDDVVQQPADISWTTIIFTLLALVLIQQIANRVIGRVVDKAIRKHKYTTSSERKKRRDTLVAVFNSVLTVLLVVIGIIVTLSQLGVNVGALIAGFGALGVVFGIAGQDLIKDFLKGFSIILYDQFRVGDIVTIAGYSGVVEALSMRFTRLRDLDGNVHVVPNGQIAVVTNQSLGYSAVNLNVGVSYASDITQVESIINRVGAQMIEEETWKQVITEPIAFLRVDSFGDSAVEIKALGRVIPGEQWAVAGEFRRRLKTAFEEEGVVIPFPQVVVHQRPVAKSAQSKSSPKD